MKVLITSGGTKIKIDLVRSITNMSRGTFGSKICDSFWKTIMSDTSQVRDASWQDRKDITFFYHKDSRVPTAERRNNDLYDLSISKIEYITYDTFDEYRDKLTQLLKKEKFDIIVLAAAVSDYGVKEVYNGKYRSSAEDMSIQLVKLPKVITEVRKLAPDSIICGFKLLVNSTDQELREAIDKQFQENGIDLCVGNDLRDIKNANHRLTIKTKFSEYFEIYEKSQESRYDRKLEDIVVDKCIEVLERSKK